MTPFAPIRLRFWPDLAKIGTIAGRKWLEMAPRPCRPNLARRSRGGVVGRSSASVELRSPGGVARPRPMHGDDPCRSHHRSCCQRAHRLDVHRPSHWPRRLFNDVCQELAEFCCSVDERREVYRRINRTIETTHRTNSHATRPVVSGKTEVETSVPIHRIIFYLV